MRASKTIREHFKTKRRIVVAILAILAGFALTQHKAARAVTLPDALPEVITPPAGDPRLEAIPGFPINLKNIVAFAGHGRLDNTHPAETTGRKIQMRFPPRVNGQSHSEGDRHADLYVLFYENNGAKVNQPFILEAVPNGATGPGATVPDLTARKFSPIWELSAVTVSSTYDPNNPATRIDSVQKVFSSPFVQKIFQTNIFVNCPVVPNGSTVDSGSRQPEQAFFEGQPVTIVFYDTEDGAFNPQALFKFEDSANGNATVMSTDSANPPNTPHLVASRLPGDPFYSAIWEVLTIRVTDLSAANNSLQAIGSGVVLSNEGDLAKLTARAQFINPDTGAARPGFSLTSAGIRMDCPVVAMATATGSDTMMQVPIDDPVALLTQSNGRFNFQKFPFDLYPTKFSNGIDRATVLRTFVISEINKPGPTPVAKGSASAFPVIDPQFKDNVIPLILQNPFQLQSSGPNSSGPIVRFSQQDLDNAYTNGLLPAGIENNFATLIADGSLTPDWGPGGRPYQDRLALVGRALFELVWTTQQGFGPKDVSNCMACHSTPAFGGSARGLYNFQGRDAGLMINPGSMFGSGGGELLIRQRKNQPLTSPLYPEPALAPINLGSILSGGGILRAAHGTQGGTGPAIRSVVVGASNTHFGIQTAEFVGTQAACAANISCSSQTIFGIPLENSSRYNPGFDFESLTANSSGDGVMNEKSVGEVTAEAAFLLTLPAPDEASASAKKLLRINDQSVQNGKQLFRRQIDKGGIGCAACHIPFHKMTTDILNLTNPETLSLLPLKVSTHTATAEDVADATQGFCPDGPNLNVKGCADVVGQKGLRLWGDQKIHKMGSLMSNSGNQLLKTAECWDCGVSFPYLRAGEFGAADLEKAILVHEGKNLPGASISKAKQTNSGGTSTQVVTITNNSSSTWGASGDPNDPTISSGLPIFIVLTGNITQGIQAIGATKGVEGGARHGAYWTYTSTVPPGGQIILTLQFSNPTGATLAYDLAVQDNAGYSQAVASTRAFLGLKQNTTFDIIAFLRAQLIADRLVEGSGGVGIPNP